ncbi:MAG: hypothetical protein HKN04_11720 [Rhodothermaceae bacterium]|nr:hypothetical protein [Rhodothermaceae bacterium]
MSNDVLNTLIMTVVMALAIGAGFYVTQKVQPAEIERLEQEEEAIRLRQAEVETLMAEESIASVEAAEALQRWNARYKILPDQLTSPDVVDYLNALSRSGFRAFDITLSGVQNRGTFSVYTYNITGMAYYESLYAFIWNVENGRGLYQLHGLSVDKEVTTIPDRENEVDRQVVLARFAMTMDAYFAGSDGMSAPDSLMEIPASVLPPRRPPVNPFYPLILTDLPNNVDDLVDVEMDGLVSVVGGQAVFVRKGEMRTLRVGDRVFLGHVASVDPNRARVVIALNKGGIRERVELDLQTGERFRQAIGSVQLENVRGPVMEDAPPAPGTPEARRSGLYQGTAIPTPQN